MQSSITIIKITSLFYTTFHSPYWLTAVRIQHIYWKYNLLLAKYLLLESKYNTPLWNKDFFFSLKAQRSCSSDAYDMPKNGRLILLTKYSLLLRSSSPITFDAQIIGHFSFLHLQFFLLLHFP